MSIVSTDQLDVCLIEFLTRWEVIIVAAVAQQTPHQRTEVDAGATET